MDKNISSQEDMQYMSSFRTLKRFRFFEPYISVLSFFIVIVCLICCFFYLDYRAVVKGLLFPGHNEKFVWLQSGVSPEVKRFDFLSQEGDDCDVYDGEWAWDESYPLYKSKDCKFLDEGFRCSENGRPDSFYTKWRWQPRHCNLPGFNAELMLEKLQNKRLVFVGDSIGRNQWESLLCMISSVVSNKSSIYEVNGNPITKHKGYLVFKFEEYNCTVEYYRAPFLVLQSRPPAGAPRDIRSTIKLDKMDWNSEKWKDADVLVLNTGHWWNYEKTIRGGCYFQEGTSVKMDMKVEHAYERSITTVMHWIHDKVNTNKTQVFFRTFAPVHFRGGEWKNGGSCHLETLPEMGSSLVPLHSWSQYKIPTDVLLAHTNSSPAIKLHILNITHMTSKRKDGHLSVYYLGTSASPASLRRQDCSHWCLPGVPDSWNELLCAFYLKHEARQSSNSTNV